MALYFYGYAYRRAQKSVTKTKPAFRKRYANQRKFKTRTFQFPVDRKRFGELLENDIVKIVM